MSEKVKETLMVGYHKYEFVQDGLTIVMDRIKEERGDVIGDMTIEADPTKYVDLSNPHIITQKQNMSSGTSKDRIAKILSGKLETPDWDSIIEYVCTKSMRKHREGHPLVQIGDLEPRKEVPYVLHPLIRRDVPCILYGESGIGKSYISLFICLLVTNEISAVGLTPTKANILYLDWEDGEQNLDERLKALAKGLNIQTPQLYYQYMDGMFRDQVHMVAKRIADNNIDLIIIDSKGAAIGGRINEADTTVQLFNYIRSLRVTSIVIDHVAKQSAIGPIGSTYTVAEARNVWEMRAGEHRAPNKMWIGFYHRKTNMSKKHNPFALEFTFDEDDNEIVQSVSVEQVDVADDSSTRTALPIVSQIQIFLKEQVMPTGEYIAQSIEDITAAIDGRTGTVKARLSDHVDKEGFWEKAGTGEYKYKDKEPAW